MTEAFRAPGRLIGAGAPETGPPAAARCRPLTPPTTFPPPIQVPQVLHSDGSLAAIEATIRTRVPKPKVSSTVMPPGGGVTLDSLRVRAVAACVYSLNAKK